MPIVLVENERTAGGRYDSWQDITGVLYHFPNAYHNKIRPGESFLYYRGVRMRTGRRPHPEYFGFGRINEVWMDDQNPDDAPKKTRKWYCSFVDYHPFTNPVPWKVDGEPLEDLPQNLFGYPRKISEENFRRVLELGGCTSSHADRRQQRNRPAADVWIEATNALGAKATRISTTTMRVVRDTPMARAVKELHAHVCQVCDEVIELRDGTRYSEAHHIQPLGRPHNGPDIVPNILVLCPICHVFCDYGAMELDLSKLRLHNRHPVGPEFIEYHNRVIFGPAD